MRVGIILYPGSNCERDCHYAVKDLLNYESEILWHKDSFDIKKYDLIILPGGFSYGDYLRPGSIARFSPIMKPLMDYAEHGGYILGICNGFQILTESGLLPGTLIKNNSLKFTCKYLYIKVENKETPFTSKYAENAVIKLPIRNGDGNYFINEAGLKELEENNQIIFRYASSKGLTKENYNPNGSLHNIAGICNKDKNILGLMPHPETSTESLLGSSDGLDLFRSVKDAV